MNQLTPTEIANAALAKARKAPIDNVDKGNDAWQQKMRLFMKMAYQTLLSSYPWPFATKRIELERVAEERPTRSYSLLYQYPREAMYLWDIYYDTQNYNRYGSIWNYRAYEYFSFDESTDTSFFDGIGEIIGDKVASNARRLFVLATLKPQIPVDKWSVPFTDAVIASLSILVEENNTTDTELLRLKLASLNQEKSNARHVTAIQNRKSQQTVRPQILDHIDSYRCR